MLGCEMWLGGDTRVCKLACVGYRYQLHGGKLALCTVDTLYFFSMTIYGLGGACIAKIDIFWPSCLPIDPGI